MGRVFTADEKIERLVETVANLGRDINKSTRNITVLERKVERLTTILDDVCTWKETKERVSANMRQRS